MKKKLVLVFVILFAFLCSACEIPREEKSTVYSYGLWPYYTFEEACEVADLIIVGTVKSVDKTYLVPAIQNPNPKSPSHYMALTDLTISVEKTLKGVEQKEIRYTQEGGETRDTIYVCDEIYELKEGERALLFLSEGDSIITWSVITNYGVIPVDQNGKITVSSTFFPGKSEDARSVQTQMDVDAYAEVISTYLATASAE